MPPPQLWSARLKVQLKLAVNRLRLVQQKQTAIAKQQRREMAKLLEVGKEQSARIRVENIIRDDINVELLEYLELYCELLLARIGLLDASTEVDPGLEEAVRTIIYAAPRTEVKELHQIRELLLHKYSPEFGADAVDDTSKKVPEKILSRLSLTPPSEELVTLYLAEIAKAYSVPFSGLKTDEKDGQDGDDEDDGPASGRIKEAAAPIAVPSNGAEKSSNPAIEVVAKSPTSDDPLPKLNLGPSKQPRDAELDDLRSRFEALRKR